jgi:hypothetical protein
LENVRILDVYSVLWAISTAPGLLEPCQSNQSLAPSLIDLISDTLPFGRLWYRGEDAINNAVGHAKFYSRSDDAVIRVYDEAGNVIDTHEHTGDFKEP